MTKTEFRKVNKKIKKVYKSLTEHQDNLQEMETAINWTIWELTNLQDHIGEIYGRK